MKLDEKLKRQAKFKAKDQNRIKAIIVQLAGLAEKARREGLLALEDDFDETSDSFFRTALQLVVDGTDPELVESILKIKLYYGGVTGTKLLEMMLIAEGALAIQRGDSPELLVETVSAVLENNGKPTGNEIIASIHSDKGRS